MMEFSPEIRLYFGILSFAFMVLLSTYSLRKRLKFMARMGDLKIWLNVHIFLGVLAAVLVVFHGQFHARGLASYPFWAMWIVILSGLVGKFLMSFVAKSREALAVQMWHKQCQLEKDIGEIGKNLPWYRGIHLHEVGGDVVIRCPWDQNLTQIFVFTKLVEKWNERKLKRAWSNAPDERLQLWREYVGLGRSLGQVDFYQKAFSFWVPLHISFSLALAFFVVVHIVSSLYFLVHW